MKHVKGGLSNAHKACSVFADFDSDRYKNWRDRKLANLAALDESSYCVDLDSPDLLTQSEVASLLSQIRIRGFALYSFAKRRIDLQASELVSVCRQLGLTQLNTNRCAYPDGVTRLQVDDSGERKHYIPYSKSGLNWHTDGYYNETKQRIRAFALHCVRNAGQGGESFLFDPELLYLYMRDENPQMVKRLFCSDVLSIPENAVNAQNIREEQSGPVFWIDKNSGGLQMRYTARTRSIRWHEDSLVTDAVAFIQETLNTSEYVQKYKLRAGEGVISNNCLHGRSAFDEEENTKAGRLLYRARYFDRITDRPVMA